VINNKFKPLNKEKKEILRSMMGSASSVTIDLNKVRDEWKYDKTGFLIKVDDLKPCNVCKEPTQYIEYCYEVRCCSEECLKILDDDYNEWVKRMIEGEDNNV
jgi:hypothetical protein